MNGSVTETEVLLERLSRVFFPYARERTAAVKATGGRFVYYTTAEVATKILRSQQMWMRNALLMNDFREIDHGLECLNVAYKGPAGQILKRALASCFPGLPEEIEAEFDAWTPSIRTDTYLTCVSEHCDHEDVRGRLSMWRAYGGSTGVALVLNGAVMFSRSNALGVFSSPVYYGDPPAFAEEFMKFAKGIERECGFIGQLEREGVKAVVVQVLQFAALCTKHPGFAEELEWRVIASPSVQTSSRVTREVELVRGVPQMVLKIKLENAPGEGLFGLALPELLDRIIVGPCEFPEETSRAFRQLLTDLQVPDPQTRVTVSDIPLRHVT